MTEDDPDTKELEALFVEWRDGMMRRFGFSERLINAVVAQRCEDDAPVVLTAH